jgi:TolB-like protein/tetratricopeptide (TPR) repeat protein
MSFFSELKRRKVYEVAAASIPAGWLILQIADILVPVLDLPIWVNKLVLLLVLLVFFAAVYLAWAYELTPDGVRRTRGAPEGETSEPRRHSELILIGVLLLLGTILYLSRETGVPTEEHAPQNEDGSNGVATASLFGDKISVAVLPFINLSDIAEQEYFADGLTEELQNTLAAIEEFRVISGTSCFVFKNTNLPLVEIAEQLGVSHVLEGSVRRTGNNVRITAQLIEAATDSHLWSENFDRTLSIENIFHIQESIATTVISTLRRRLLRPSWGDANLPVHKVADSGVSKSFDASLLPGEQYLPSNLGALDHFNAGMSSLRQISIGEASDDKVFMAAVSQFDAAIAADPGWVLPVAWLGHTYQLWSRGGHDREKLELSRHHVIDALERTPDLAIAHQTLGNLLWTDGRFQESLDSLVRAESLGADVHNDKGNILLNMGRTDDAVSSFQLAVSVDPLSPTVQTHRATAMQCVGMHSDVVANEDKLVTIAPNSSTIKALLARSYARLGNRNKALSYVREIVSESQRNPALADVYALIGEKERARQAIEDLESRGEGLVSAATAALVLGEPERGIDLIESHASSQSVPGDTAWLFCEPEIRALAGNPRYDAVLASRGLQSSGGQ